MKLANLLLHIFSAFGLGCYTVFYIYIYLYSYLINTMEPSTFGFLMSLLFGNLFAATLAGGIITYNSKKLTPQKYMILEIVNHSLSILGYFACVVVAVVNYVNAVRLHVKELAKPRLNIDSIVFVGIALGIAGIVVTVIIYSKTKAKRQIVS